jgi:excisionase family DNA binding protein
MIPDPAERLILRLSEKLAACNDEGVPLPDPPPADPSNVVFLGWPPAAARLRAKELPLPETPEQFQVLCRRLQGYWKHLDNTLFELSRANPVFGPARQRPAGLDDDLGAILEVARRVAGRNDLLPPPRPLDRCTYKQAMDYLDDLITWCRSADATRTGGPMPATEAHSSDTSSTGHFSPPSGNSRDTGATGSPGTSSESPAASNNKPWLTVDEAACVSGIHKGTISRLANKGDLKSNGEKRLKRRIDSADLNRYQLERVKKAGPSESDEAVERKLKKAQQPHN